MALALTVVLLLAGCSPTTPIPTPTSTPTPEPTATPTPEPSPVELAIKAGRLELKGEANEWEKYFIGVSAEEAERLLNEANRGLRLTEGAGGVDDDKLKILLPFDPRGAPKLKLEIVNTNRQYYTGTFLGITGLPVGTVFYAPVSGEAKAIMRSGIIPAKTAGGLKDIEIAVVNTKIDHYSYSFQALRRGARASFPEESPTPVKIGTPLFYPGTTETLGDKYPWNQQMVYEFMSLKTGPHEHPSSLEQLLIKDGKIVFIGQ